MSLMYEDAARQPDQAPACVIGYDEHGILPAGHKGHHPHQVPTGVECSCGLTLGICSFVVPDWTSEQFAAWDREHTCSICGAEGVIEDPAQR